MLCATFLALALLPPPRLDADGIPLPAEAVRRLGSARFLVNNFAGAAFSPDGKTVYTVSGKDSSDWRVPHTSPGLIAWEVPTGKKRWQAGVDGHLEQVVADPDGKSVWVIERVKRVVDEERDQIQRVRYSAADGKELARTPFVESIQSPALHPTGLMADANQITDREGKSTELPPIRPVQGESIGEVAWSPAADRLFLFSGSWEGERGLTALDVSKGEQLWSVGIDPPGGWCVAPDGKSVVLITQRKGGKVFARRLDAKTGKELDAVHVPGVRPFDDLRMPILGRIYLPPDSKTFYLIGKEGRTVAVDVAAWKVVETKVKVAANSVFSPDGRMTLAPSGRNVVLHDFATGKRLSPGEPGFERADHNTQLRFSAQSDRLLRRGHWTERAETEWDITSGRQTRHVEEGYDSTDRGTLSADGEMKAVVEEEGDGWRVTVTKVNSLKAPPVVLKAGWHDGGWPYRWMSFTPDAGHLVGADPHYGVHIWDVKGNGKPAEVKFRDAGYEGICSEGMKISPNGRLVAVVERGQPVAQFVPPSDEWAWQLGVYEIPSGKVVNRFEGTGKLEAFQWVDDRIAALVNFPRIGTPFGREITPKNPKSQLVRLDPATKTMLVHRIEADVRSWAAAPYGDSFAVGSSDALRLFETSTGKVRHTFREQTRPVEVLAFSPNGRYLAAESTDGPVLVWDVRGDLTKPARPDAAGWNAAWAALGEDEAEAAFRAVRLFALFPDDGAAELKARFAALKPPTADAVAALVAQLEDPDFARRQQAEKELRSLGTAARPALERALAGNPSEELRTRAEKLLAVAVPADLLRAERAVEALRLADSEAARKVVVGWANGPKGDPLTVAAMRK